MNVHAVSPLKPRRSVPVLLTGGALLLAGGVLLQALTFRNLDRGDTVSARAVNHLAPLFPERIPGWECRNEKLGPTEFTQEAAKDILNFDDYLFRSYTRPGQSFTLYIAYWRPGRMPVQRVAGHNPDICWTGAGWKREESKAGAMLRAGGITLRPAQWRKMQFPGQPVQYVAFWHLVGGHLYDQNYYLNSIPSPLAYWREAMHYALGGQREQYLVRLTASVPFSELETDPGYREIFQALAGLGLAESGRSSPAE
jgi:EpsI family protein